MKETPDYEVSVVMPCLNESETIGTCIRKAKETMEKLGMVGEIVIADNGSTDNSIEIAESMGARVVHEKERGYGNAYRAGILAAQGKYIVMGDSDDSYDFTDLGRFIEPLREGAEFVMGTRLKGQIKKGAMPWLHRYIGNPVLTGILNVFFKSGISDAHCGIRSFRKEAYLRLDLQTTGMEFASEMVIKAAMLKLKTVEIPIVYYPDGRSRRPHLRSFRDGWRHLRFMLLHSPTHLFIWPGMLMLAIGLISMILLLPGPIRIFGRLVDLHVMVLGSLLSILGYQVSTVGLYARVYAVKNHFVPKDTTLQNVFKVFNLERGLVAGSIVALLGLSINLYILIKWVVADFGPLSEVRLALLASTLIIIGVQTIFSSFFLSMLGIETRPPRH